VRIAGVIHESVVDGPGVRFVVFAQGCLHHCRGCHNPETWDPDEGREITLRALTKELRKVPVSVKGITLSGGEPFLQPREMAMLASKAHSLGLSVTVYTGYLYEELIQMALTNPEIGLLLDETDILVDGPFVEDLKDIQLRFRGSKNQRVIDLLATKATGRISLVPEENTQLQMI